MANSAKDSLVMKYKDTIRQLNSTITAQNELIRSLKEMLSASNTATANLQEQVAYLTRKLFGTSSEVRQEFVRQLSLFDEAEQEASTSVLERTEEETTVQEHTRKSKSKSEEIFKGVPVKEEVIELPEEEQVCVTCNAPLERIGKEFVRQEFAWNQTLLLLVPYKALLYRGSTERKGIRL